MAFTDYKSIEQVLRKESVRVLNEAFLPDNLEKELPAWFLDDIAFALATRSSQETETFYEEFLIVPFLKEIWKQHRQIKVWSHVSIKYDDDLCGCPDYLISGLCEENSYEVLNTPLLAAVQAKQQDFVGGWGQCLAAMLACQKINADRRKGWPRRRFMGSSQPVRYGSSGSSKGGHCGAVQHRFPLPRRPV